MVMYNINRALLAAVLSIGFLFTACNSDGDYALESLSGFGVSSPATVKVGEPVLFELSGNPNIVIFYSGEAGHVYHDSSEDKELPPVMTISFQSEMSAQGSGGLNPSAVQLLYSSDFSGVYSTQALQEATWTDASGLFDWPLVSGQEVQGGNVDMLPFFKDGNTVVYLRFDYVVKAYNAVTQPNSCTQWYIRNLSVQGGAGNELRELYGMYECGWAVVPLENYELNTSPPLMPTEINSRMWLRTQNRPEVDIRYSVVSAPLSHVSSLNKSSDSGVTIKTFANPRLKSYSYVFDEEGEYQVTFVGINANATGRVELAKSVTIKVVQDSGTLVAPEYSEWNY